MPGARDVGVVWTCVARCICAVVRPECCALLPVCCESGQSSVTTPVAAWRGGGGSPAICVCIYGPVCVWLEPL